MRKDKNILVDENVDWTNANVEGVTVNGIPLDGKYLEHLIESLEEE